MDKSKEINRLERAFDDYLIDCFKQGWTPLSLNRLKETFQKKKYGIVSKMMGFLLIKCNRPKEIDFNNL